MLVAQEVEFSQLNPVYIPNVGSPAGSSPADVVFPYNTTRTVQQYNMLFCSFHKDQPHLSEPLCRRLYYIRGSAVFGLSFLFRKLTTAAAITPNPNPKFITNSRYPL